MDHISTITNIMFNACPLCGAKPMQPCHNVHSFLKEEVRYTHTERNRG